MRTGAQNDLTQVTRLVRQMVTRWGMRPGDLATVEGDDDQGGGYDALRGEPYSEVTAALIDQDVQRLLDDAHKRTRDILTRSRAQLDQVAQALLRSETVYADGRAKILGFQPSVADLIPKQFSLDGKNLEEVTSMQVH